MANKAEELRSIAVAVRRAIEMAEREDHKFLTYLLKMAELESQELLEQHVNRKLEQP